MSVRINIARLALEGVQYWKASDVVAAVSELLIAARTDDERVLVAWFLRALQKIQTTEL